MYLSRLPKSSKTKSKILPALAEKLRAFAAFNGCERIAIEETEPGKVKTYLEPILKVSRVAGVAVVPDYG